MSPLMTISTIVAGAILGALFGPSTHPGEANALAQCAEAMSLRDLMVYAVTTPSDCAGSAFGRSIGLGRAMLGALGGAGFGAAAAWAAGWLARPSPPTFDAVEAELRARCRDVEAAAAEIEHDRARGWAIVPSQGERHQRAVAALQEALHASQPARASAIVGDVLWQRPELAAVVLATHRHQPALLQILAGAVMVLACAVAVAWGAAGLLAP